MDDKTKVEVMWEERQENKRMWQAVQADIGEIKLLLATARGGLRVTTILWGIIGSVVTFVATYFLNKKEH